MMRTVGFVAALFVIVSCSVSRGDLQPETGARIVAPRILKPTGNTKDVTRPLNTNSESSGGILQENVEIDDLVSVVMETHASLRAARERVQSAENRIPQASALPDPVLGNTYWPNRQRSLQTAGGRTVNQISLSQRVPWPKKLRSRAAVAAHEVEIGEANLKVLEQELAESTRLAYYDLWFIQRTIEIVETNRQLVADLIGVAEARYRTGGSQQDVLRAQLETDKLDEQLIELRWEQENVRAELGALVGRPVTFVATAAVSLESSSVPLELEKLIRAAEQCNPTIHGLNAEIARDQGKNTLAELQTYPDFNLGLGWSFLSDDDVLSPVANGRDNFSITLGVTIPMWREKLDAEKKEAAHQYSSSVNRRQAEWDRIKGQLRRLVAAAVAAREQTVLFEDRLIPRTEQTLSIATAAYRTEQTDFYRLIDLYQELLTHQLHLARTKANLFAIFARIERSVGC